MAPPSQSYLKPAKRVTTPKTRFIALKKSGNINSILKQLKDDQYSFVASPSNEFKKIWPENPSQYMAISKRLD